MNPYTLTLADPLASIETVGGKGNSLAKLARAGFPVPGGFHVTTEAYRQFVAANGLQAGIDEALRDVDVSRPGTLEAASQAIMRLFLAAPIPGELVSAIVQAYAALPGQDPAVAVRSSATAEDLPNASFAGQQETYLNISGADSVLEATRKCWASLWTGRAIGYRFRQGIGAEGVALAVVVQLLINAEAAGIMFTANPLTSNREEVVINAAWGLGEAIVGGAVTPDTMTVNKRDNKLTQRETAKKLVMTVRATTGTDERPVPDALMNIAVLSDEKAGELARIGVQIENLYGAPMDIEWTLADGEFAILQARPITTLDEAPLEWKRPLPDGVYMRTSVVDLMPDPLSPLFATLGIPALVAQMYPVGKKLTRMEPSLPEGYYTTINGYAYMNAHFSGRAWLWILFGLLPSYPRLLRTIVPFWREEARPQYRQAIVEWEQKNPAQMSCKELWQGVKAIMDAAANYTSALLFATMGASAGSEGLLTKVYEKMVRREGDPPATALLMGWDNIPSRSEKSLYDLAKFCQAHEALQAYVLKTPASELVDRLNSGDVPLEVGSGEWQELRQQFSRHLDAFGYMVFDLDLAKPLPCDHPEPMLEAVKMYLRGEGTNPYERQKASEQKRIQITESALRRLKGLRRWAFRKSLNWAQSLSEVREDALAEIGLGYPSMRQMLHILGERLVKAGILQEAGDIYWMESEEVDKALLALDGGAAVEDMSARIQQRKAFLQKARQVTPPPMLPPRKRYLGINTTVWLAESEDSQAKEALKGVPASPGRVTAPARVLHGPEDFEKMRPGDVLVAGTTTPAWTPLFAMASAVVTDIGGPLSHGSIVAREYGIPAVMGTGIATRRIQDGQTITVDGEAGIVTISAG